MQSGFGVDLNRVFVTSNVLEKTDLPSCGSFRGFCSIVWLVEISGSRSLASAPIDSAELFLGLGLVSPSPLPTAKEGDLVCDSTSCSAEGAWSASSAIEGTFSYFAAVSRSTTETRNSFKDKSDDAKTHVKNRIVPRFVVHQGLPGRAKP